MTEKAFQKSFLEAVDAAFSSLGESAKQSIYFHLENKFKLSKDDIPCRLVDFDAGLEKIFGAGTRFLEVLIMKKLHENMGPAVGTMKWEEKKEFKFVDYVKTAEQSYSGKKKRD